MGTEDEVRKGVSEFYTKAVKAGTGCCGPAASSCCGGAAGPAEAVVPKGFAAQFAGYGDEVAGLPADAVENSFGCGNPLAFSEVREGDVVLDLGSGAGIDLLVAARKVGPSGRVIGVDMTDEMIERARANIARAGLQNVEVRKGLIEDLPVPTGSVDWVISNCVINLSPEKDRVFGEIARVLKPGGRMRVSDIVVEDLPAWVRDSMALYASCVAGAVSESEYLAGLRRAGLEDVQVVERFPYGEEMLRGFIASEVPGLEAAAASCCGPAEAAPTDACGCCCGEPAKPVDLEAVVADVAGKVVSAKFAARKPL